MLKDLETFYNTGGFDMSYHDTKDFCRHTDMKKIENIY